jgi:hypothetical protein
LFHNFCPKLIPQIDCRKKKKGTKAVKQIMSHLFHHQRSLSADRIDKIGSPSKKKSDAAGRKLIPPSVLASAAASQGQNGLGSASAATSNGLRPPTSLSGSRQALLPSREQQQQRAIGHPASGAMSEFGYPAVAGRRYGGGTSTSTLTQPHRYRRFHDYSSFSSFSETSSIIRRPSVDTISTYLGPNL